MVRKNEDLFFTSYNDFSFPIRKDLVENAEKAVWEEKGKNMVRIGIRPENMTISLNKKSEASFELPVYVVVHEAETSTVSFELTDVFLLVKTPTKAKYQDNQKVWIDINQDNLHFFQKSIEITK